MPYDLVNQEMVAAAEDEDSPAMNAFVTKHIPLPERLLNKNVNLVIEINGAGIQRFKTFYMNQFKVTLLEAFGELKVTDLATNKPMPRTYVKVYGLNRSSGKEFFFKDGYTDIRGKFEYAQTSGDKLKDTTKFAILVRSDEKGSKIMECKPPNDSTGNGQPMAGGLSGLAFSKMNRMVQRQNIKNSTKNRC